MTSESTVMTDDDFTSIPILNYALVLSSPNTRSVFVRQLQNALINVGFLYLENTTTPANPNPPIPEHDHDDHALLFDEVIAYLPRIFALPQDRKDAMRMANSVAVLPRVFPSRRVERTGGAANHRSARTVRFRDAV